MRRKDRQVENFSDIVQIIDECDIIRIGLADGDFPYIVPLNFAYTVQGEQIDFYVHGAVAGRKYERMREHPKCSFEMDLPIEIACFEETGSVTMYYRSVMGTAQIQLLEGEEKQRAVEDILLARSEKTRSFPYNKNSLARTAVAKLQVLSLTAKENLPAGWAKR